MDKKNVNYFLHHYIGQDAEVAEDWHFKTKDTLLGLAYSKGFRMPLIGAVLDMIVRPRNPLIVKPVLRRYKSMNEQDKLRIMEIIGMSPFELNDGNGFWYARNYTTKERFRVDLEPTAFNGFHFWTEGNDYEKVTFPSNIQLTMINDYLQSQGIWIYGEEWFDEGLIIEKKL